MPSSDLKATIALQHPSFDPHQLSDCHLIFYVGPYSLRMACMSLSSRTCLWIASYPFSHAGAAPLTPHHLLQTLCHQHPIFQAPGWGKVTLCVDHQQYTLVPQPLLNPEEASSYLQTLCDPPSLKTFTHLLKKPQAGIAFGVDADLAEWFQKTYIHTPHRLLHASANVMAGSLVGTTSSQPSHVWAWVAQQHLHLVVLREQELTYYNRFSHNGTSEAVQWLLVVMQGLALDPAIQPVVLVDLAGWGRPLLTATKRYIRHVHQGPPVLPIDWQHPLSTQSVSGYVDVLSAHFV